MARFTGENLGRANGLWATITHGVIHVFLTGRPLRVKADRFQDRRWLARVSGANGLAKGAAWAVDSEHLVTGAHVD
jgi:hypothetical protein